MTSTPPTVFDALYTVAQRAGRRIGGRNSEWVSVSDAVQEAMVWLIEHPERVERATTNGVVNRPRIYAEVAWHLVEWVNRERRQHGYHPEDHQRYTAGMVEAILPFVWGPLSKPQSDGNGGGGSADPAVGGDWLALQLDVTRGLALLDKTQRAVLLMRFGQGEQWATVAATVGLTVEGARKRARRAVTTIVRFLNGLHPDDAQWGGPGRRRVMSNGAAQWLTREQYAPPGSGAY